MLVVGITGTLGAGKGTVVEMLKEKGFVHYSARDYIRKRVQAMGLKPDRDTFTMVANAAREKEGGDFIAKGLLEQANKDGKNCIIESIRNVKEVEYLKKHCNFVLLCVDADIKIRYSRIIKRDSETDNVDFDTFVADEQREMSPTDENKQNLGLVIRMADYTIDNSKDLDNLKQQVDKIYSCLPLRHRLTWDEYFLEVVKTVAKRATCDRGRSGCVIVKDKQILVTGYVGSPTGLPHCDDVGHLFKKTINEEGEISTHCVRTVHAEQNAICQAAKRGIALEGATLYCTMTPCRVCAMMIINCGIKRVVCLNKYHSGQESEEMFNQAGIQLDFVSEEVVKYDHQ